MVKIFRQDAERTQQDYHWNEYTQQQGGVSTGSCSSGIPESHPVLRKEGSLQNVSEQSRHLHLLYF